MTIVKNISEKSEMPAGASVYVGDIKPKKTKITVFKIIIYA